MENWKQIVGHERYFVSDHGRVKNSSGKILYLCVSKKGYHRVQLYLGNNTKKIPYVHRLVAKAFIPNPENHPQINHKDANKINNHVDNLEWCTNQHNADHAMAHGLIVPFKGEKHPRATVTMEQVREIRAAILTKDLLRSDLAKKYGTTKGVIKDIRSRKSWNYL